MRVCSPIGCLVVNDCKCGATAINVSTSHMEVHTQNDQVQFAKPILLPLHLLPFRYFRNKAVGRTVPVGLLGRSKAILFFTTECKLSMIC